MSTHKRTLTNIASNIVSWGWLIALSFITTPLILHKLGADAYGVIALITLIIGYLSALDLGLNVAGVKFISQYSASSQKENIQKVLSTTIALFAILGLIGALIIWIFAPNLSEQIFQVPENLSQDATNAFRLAGFIFLLIMLTSAISSIPPALQRYDISNVISSGANSTTLIATLVLAYWGFGIPQIIFATVLINLFVLLAYIFIAQYLLPNTTLQLRIDKSMLRTLLSFGSFALVNRIIGLVLLQVDRTLIAIWLGPAALTFYVIPLGLARRIQELIAQASSLLLPLSSELHSRKDTAGLRILYLRATSLTFIISTGLAVVLLSYRESILSIWVGQDFAHQTSGVLGILTISSYILSLSAVGSLLIHGLGFPQVDTKFASFTGIIDLALCFILIPTYGITGAAIARMLSVAIPLFPYLWYIEKNYLGLQPLREWFSLSSKPFILGIGIYFVTVLWVKQYANNLISLALLSFISLILYFAILLKIGGFMEKDKLLIIELSKSLLSIGKSIRVKASTR
ncbi:MAG: hypothetical protein EXR62_07815 [Chloroflexi bacterium]|nr:hypothetical protein [Chloroflexota bacterium]